MRKMNAKELLIWAAAIVPFIAVAYFYPSLPEKIPTHWNAAGQIDAWGGRNSAFLTPLMGLGISLLFKFLPKIDPKRRNYSRFGEAYYAMRLVFILYMNVLTGIILYSAFNPERVAVNVLIPASVGILFAVIGNFMPKFKHNYFVGIRTPWTLANEDVWYKTHRLGGVLWFWGGLSTAVLAFVIPSSIFFALFMAVVFTISLIPVIYSYVLFRKTDKKTENNN